MPAQPPTQPRIPGTAAAAASPRSAVPPQGRGSPRSLPPPSPRPAQPPLQSYAARQALQKLTARTLATLGGAAEDRATGRGRLTIEVLRLLDLPADHPDATSVPPALRAADLQAQRELVAWYAARGLPAPDEEADPGEPQSAAEGAIDFPRANPVTAEQKLVEFLKCRRDPVYLVDNYMSLRHPVRGTIPFRLWRWQAWLLHQYLTRRLVIELKARQLGASELAAAFAGWKLLFFDSQTILFLSKDENSAIELLNRAKVLYTHMPAWLKVGMRDSLALSETPTWNTRTFAIPHIGADGHVRPSVIHSLPANANTGRSATASLVVLDEWAFEAWPEAIWAAVEPTIDAGGSLIGISTANGLGGTFERIWSNAVKGDNHFFPVFLSWRRHPDRTAEWYEKKKANTEAWQLHQEYPSEPTEAFIQSGNPVFDQAYLVTHESRIDAEIAARTAEGQPAWAAVDGLTIYEEPQAGHRYVIGADVAGGRGDGDFDVACVLDAETLAQAAELRGQWPFEIYATRLYELGTRYNNATLAVERNNHGHAILLALQSGLANKDAEGKPGKPYANIYHHQEALVPGRRQDARPGWETNLATKPRMIDALALGLREGTYLVRSKAFLEEARVFAYQDTGYASAPRESGRHDDCVMAHAIAVYIASRPNAVQHTLAFVQELRTRVESRVTELVAASRTPPSAQTHTHAPALDAAALAATVSGHALPVRTTHTATHTPSQLVAS